MVEICISITTTIISGLLLFVIKENHKLKKAEKAKKEKEEEEEVKKQEVRDELLLGVARVQLTEMMQKALDRGETTQTEYEVIEALYEPYKRSGGNGVVKHLFEDRYNKLKVKS